MYSTRRQRLALAFVGMAAVLVDLDATGVAAADANDAKRDQKAYFDIRQSTSSQKVLRQRAAKLDAQPSAAVTALSDSLGNEGIVAIDPLTTTPRMVGRTDAFLTGPSSATAASVALGYVSGHASAIGLSSADLSSLTLARDYVDIGGTHHLSWVQHANGIPLFGNGLQANVRNDGRLINVVGSPVGSLSAPSTSPGINASQALAAAKADAGT